MSRQTSVIDTLRGSYPKLHDAERKVAKYVMANPESVLEMSTSTLAKASGVSDATIVRMCQHAGFKGYYQMRLVMSRDIGSRGTVETDDIDENPIGHAINTDIARLKTLENEDNKEAIAKAAKMLCKAGMVIATGAGNTATIAQDFSFRLNRFGIRSFSSAVPENTMNYVANSGPGDVLVAISKSGSSTITLQIVKFAKRHRLKVIAMTGDLESTIGKAAHCAIDSGSSDGILTKIQHGLESHLGELLMADAILYAINMELGATKGKRGEEAELEIASWKE